MQKPNIGSSPKATLIAAAIAALFPIHGAQAQRPNTQSMSCVQARGKGAAAAG